MSDGEFWIKFWSRVLPFLAFIALLAMVSCQNTKLQVKRMVELGAEPMEAACAIDGSASTVCYQYLATKAVTDQYRIGE